MESRQRLTIRAKDVRSSESLLGLCWLIEIEIDWYRRGIDFSKLGVTDNVAASVGLRLEPGAMVSRSKSISVSCFMQTVSPGAPGGGLLLPPEIVD